MTAKSINARDIVVCSEDNRFCAWPANGGIWAWDDEILVGFDRFHWRNNGRDLHSLDDDKGKNLVQARSRDGGETWEVEGMDAAGQASSLDFSSPDIALRFVMTDKHRGHTSFAASMDRGQSWSWHDLPMFDRRGVMGRTDYILFSAAMCLAGLAVSNKYGREGRVLYVATQDGGRTWHPRGYLGDEALEGFRIMPSTVVLPGRVLLACTRYSNRSVGTALEFWKSYDAAATWVPHSSPIQIGTKGNPPHMVRLPAGRLVLTYGVREPGNERIVARISDNAGDTWSDEVIIRTGFANWDMGYTRSAVRRDGSIVTVYYAAYPNEQQAKIEATIWRAE